ncbi:phage integrase [Candidatus Enterovibrio escicola]|uniref:phage integrase n=1 Tax=Candidatus Enterovibrio escicola TaxID=1927127 RepID=UPI003C12FC0A
MLSEVITLWYKLYGQTLKRGKCEQQRLLKIDKITGHHRAYQITKLFFICL